MQKNHLGFFGFLLLFIFGGMIMNCANPNQPINILLVTGGHEFDEQEFFDMFSSMERVNVESRTQPKANRSFVTDDLNKIDVVVFYDMVESLGEDEKAAYIRLLKTGTNMLFLHHSLCSYQDWDQFEKIVGGKYLLREEVRDGNSVPPSTYKHDVNMSVQMVDAGQTITEGLKDFTLFDEVYGGFLTGPGVRILLRTDHQESTPEIAWTHRYENSQIVYIQPGHSKHAFNNADYRQLIYQAIRFLENEE